MPKAPSFEAVSEFPIHFSRVEKDTTYFRLGCIGCKNGCVFKIEEVDQEIGDLVWESMGEFPKPVEVMNVGFRGGQTDVCQPGICEYSDRITRTIDKLNGQYSAEL
jgi:hypothetical protein